VRTSQFIHLDKQLLPFEELGWGGRPVDSAARICHGLYFTNWIHCAFQRRKRTVYVIDGTTQFM